MREISAPDLDRRNAQELFFFKQIYCMCPQMIYINDGRSVV